MRIIFSMALQLALVSCGIAREVDTSQCFLLQNNSLILKSSCSGWSIENILVAENQYRGNCDGDETAAVAANTKLVIDTVILSQISSHGRCRRVTGVIVTNQTFHVEVPSCFLHHPDSWFGDWSYSDWIDTQSNQELTRLVPNEEYLKPCP